ncbi:MAG: hypothetical protein ACE5G0_22460 [Rhodothermales bacterium]
MAKKEPSTSDPAQETTTATSDVTNGQEEPVRDDLRVLQLTAAECYDKLATAAAGLSEQARGVYETNRAYYQKHPGRILFTVGAVGVVIGLLLGRKSSG